MAKKKIKKDVVLRWVKLISFGVVLLGGLNYLLMGLFGLDLFGVTFGGGVVSRVFYSLFGIAAAVLLTAVLWKAFMGEREQTAESKTEQTKSA
jgi:hypothetical protein